MDNQNKIKSLWYKIRNCWAAYAVAGIMGLNAAACGSGSSPKTDEKKTDTVENTIKVKNPVKQIKYKTDTLSAVSGRALLYYQNGYITRNYVDKKNIYQMSLPLFSHEDWHAIVDLLKWRLRYKYTPFEYYKLCMHNEITANIAALLTTRYQYMAAENKKEFAKEHLNGIFGFYFKEVLQGKINPESTNTKDLEREYSLIANGMQKAWMERCSKWYMPSFYGMLQRYVANQGFIEDSKKSYNHVRKHMYTIGGVDFSKYLKQDIMPADTRVFLAEGLRNVKSLSDGGAEIMNFINGAYPLMENVGFEKQKEAFQHLLVSSKLKYELRNRTPEELQENPQMIDMYYRQTIAKLQSDKTFAEYVNNFPTINEKSCALKVYNAKEYKQIISQMYEFKGMNLRKVVKDFKIKNVPVKTVSANDFYFGDIPYYWSSVSEVKGEEWRSPYRGVIVKAGENNVVRKNYKKRQSDWQFIAAPDYSQPILTAAEQKDKEAILKAIKDFDNIPQVLKECDTEAQKAYYASLEKNAEKQNSYLNQNKNSARNR